MPQLPTALKREPLIDAIFEVRLNARASLAEILPGALFSGSSDKPTITRLPAADFPQPLRAQDPNLKFAPLVKIEFANYTVSVSDQSYVVGCKLPYPKWPAFKQILINVTKRISESGIPGEIERFSLKYVNLIEAASLKEQLSKIQLDIKLGLATIDDHVMQLRAELHEDGLLHIISIASGAVANFEHGREAAGIVVDVDSIKNAKFASFSAFDAELSEEIEQLRQSNKRHFFDCLTPGAIEEMGPIYE